MSKLLGDLADIQRKLKATKSQFNSFGKYNYRSCEDILEAVKPLLKHNILIITDEPIEVGGRIYIRATATFSGDGQVIETSAVAREAETKKGMDDAQITGSASSYARKYALNGLFCIDDNKDPDTGPPVELSFDKVKLHQEKVREHFQSISCIKEYLPQNGVDGRGSDMGYAMEAWFEVPLADRRILALAPSKGGIFTTAERAIVCGQEFTAEHTRRVKEGLEKPTTPDDYENNR